MAALESTYQSGLNIKSLPSLIQSACLQSGLHPLAEGLVTL
jgi:hypothetical protein